MTTSAVRTLKRTEQAGFTLLEIMFAIGLIALMVTVAFVSYKPDSAGLAMQKASVELESLAARGHTMAVLHQKPFWLRFDGRKVILEGAELEQVEVPLEGFYDEEENLEFQRVRIEDVKRTVEYETYEPEERLKIFVRRWGAQELDWFRKEKEEQADIYWEFESTGLCEPISIRFEIEDSWMELGMDPLTGRIQEELSEIYD